MTRNLVRPPLPATAVTHAEARQLEKRSPTVEPVPASFDLQTYLSVLCAQPVTVCPHFNYDVLRNHLSGPADDHDTLDAECQTCGQLISVTCYADERVEYAVMDAAYAIRQGYAT